MTPKHQWSIKIRLKMHHLDHKDSKIFKYKLNFFANPNQTESVILANPNGTELSI